MTSLADQKHRQRPIFVIPASPSMKGRPAPRKHKGPHLFTIFLLLLAFLALARFIFVLVASTALTSSTTDTPGECNGLLRASDFTKIIGLQPGEQIGAIAAANELDGGSPAELVQVMHSDAQETLDVYLFGCAIHQNRPGLISLFSQHGLVDGTVEMSQANTLITGTLDASISANASVLLLPSQQNIYREYAFQSGTFQQVAFPGFYPVTSRAEAETLQKQADGGMTVPWIDPLATAAALAKDILKWPAIDPQNALLSNDGVIAQVKLVQQSPPLAVYVTLERLVRQDGKGLWFVVAAHTQAITLGLDGQVMTALPQAATLPTQTRLAERQTLVQSPITLQGTNALVDGQSSVTLFDHTLSPVSTASNVPLQVNSNGIYVGTLPYTTVVPGQEGLLLVQSLPQTANDALEQGQLLLVPVLLG